MNRDKNCIKPDIDMTDGGYKFTPTKCPNTVYHKNVTDGIEPDGNCVECQMEQAVELRQTKYRIRAYKGKYLVGDWDDGACKIIARFNCEDLGEEYCTLKATIDRQTKLIHDLETDCDPAGTVQENFALKENQVALEATIDRQAEELKKE